jgi:hypothetical protein
MKVSSRSLYLQMAAVAAGLLVGISMYAETPREELSHAYILVRMADGDYAGHRAEALKSLQAAGKALGLELRGKGSGHEQQLKSDEQLAEARRLLRDSRDKLEERDRNLAAKHVERAMKELDAALKVK